jgi:predicted Zn-ribbon and HTH transcriptional regulator
MTLQLTDAEQQFLRDQNLRESDVFDGRSLSKTVREAEARKIGKPVIVIAGACKKGGHRFQTRNGHCPQCDTSKLRYQARHREKAFVYVAYSLSRSLTKIGVSIDLDTRERKINFDGYAGATDWEMLFYIQVEEAGRVETSAQARLTKFKRANVYLKDGKLDQVAKESFNCPPHKAVNAVIEAIKAIAAAHGEPWVSEARLKQLSE